MLERTLFVDLEKVGISNPYSIVNHNRLFAGRIWADTQTGRWIETWILKYQYKVETVPISCLK